MRFPVVISTCVLLAGLAMPAIVRAAPDDQEFVPAPEAAGGFEIAEANFDQWVFQGAGSAEAGRKRIASWLALHLDEVDRVCGLDDDQKLKLRLAAGGDTRRFFEEVEVVRRKFLEVRNDQNAFGQLWQEIQPLQMKQSAGLFGARSLFAKTLRKTLTSAQLAKYGAVQEERRRYRYQSSIEVALQNLSSAVPLRAAQHEALVRLMMDKTPPPYNFTQMDSQYVLYQMSQLPAQEVQPLLDERQWKLLSLQMAANKHMRQFLVQNGAIAKAGEQPPPWQAADDDAEKE